MSVQAFFPSVRKVVQGASLTIAKDWHCCPPEDAEGRRLVLAVGFDLRWGRLSDLVFVSQQLLSPCLALNTRVTRIEADSQPRPNFVMAVLNRM